MKSNDELSVGEVAGMNLAEFEERFGFVPADALDKLFFAVVGKRMDDTHRRAFESHLLEHGDLSRIVME